MEGDEAHHNGARRREEIACASRMQCPSQASRKFFLGERQTRPRAFPCTHVKADGICGLMRRLILVFLLIFAALPARAQKFQIAAGEAPGPWIFGTIGVGKGADKMPKTTALKGLAVKVGERGEAAVCYDLDLCRMAAAWTGGKFTTP